MKRFWSKVKKSSSCWIWIASLNDGYGSFGFKGTTQFAHRVAWQLKYGDIPKRMMVLHSCDTRRCVRPSHLHLGTAADNSKEASERGIFPCGTAHHSSKLDGRNIRRIRRLAVKGTSYSKLAKYYGVTIQSIYAVVHRQTWKQISG